MSTNGSEYATYNMIKKVLVTDSCIRPFDALFYTKLDKPLHAWIYDWSWVEKSCNPRKMLRDANQADSSLDIVNHFWDLRPEMAGFYNNLLTKHRLALFGLPQLCLFPWAEMLHQNYNTLKIISLNIKWLTPGLPCSQTYGEWVQYAAQQAEKSRTLTRDCQSNQ